MSRLISSPFFHDVVNFCNKKLWKKEKSEKPYAKCKGGPCFESVSLLASCKDVCVAFSLEASTLSVKWCMLWILTHKNPFMIEIYRVVFLDNSRQLRRLVFVCLCEFDVWHTMVRLLPFCVLLAFYVCLRLMPGSILRIRTRNIRSNICQVKKSFLIGIVYVKVGKMSSLLYNVSYV